MKAKNGGGATAMLPVGVLHRRDDPSRLESTPFVVRRAVNTDTVTDPRKHHSVRPCALLRNGAQIPSH